MTVPFGCARDSGVFVTEATLIGFLTALVALLVEGTPFKGFGGVGLDAVVEELAFGISFVVAVGRIEATLDAAVLVVAVVRVIRLAVVLLLAAVLALVRPGRLKVDVAGLGAVVPIGLLEKGKDFRIAAGLTSPGLVSTSLEVEVVVVGREMATLGTDVGGLVGAVVFVASPVLVAKLVAGLLVIGTRAVVVALVLGEIAGLVLKVLVVGLDSVLVVFGAGLLATLVRALRALVVVAVGF